MDKHERTILFRATCFHPEIKITISIPNNCDEEDYIEQYLDSILNTSARYNAEWDFV